MTEPTHHRYAVYYAPAPGSVWCDAGSRWLGRSTRHRGPDAAMLDAATVVPRRYGWHATLKAPFALRDGHGLQMLRSALRRLAAQLQPVPLPALRVRLLGDFLALVPQGDTTAIDQIAAACVTELQPLAAPLNESELQRRRKAGLSASEDAMLLAWGYPYVLAHYRFHMTLTGPLRDLPAPLRAALQAAAERAFHGLPDTGLDSLSLFAEPAPGADFVLLEQFALGTACPT
jgi:hypothetical protein